MPDGSPMGFGLQMNWIKLDWNEEIFHMKSSMMLSNYELHKLKVPANTNAFHSLRILFQMNYYFILITTNVDVKYLFKVINSLFYHFI